MTSINFYERFAVVFLTFAVFFMGFYYAYSPVQACIRESNKNLEKEYASDLKSLGEETANSLRNMSWKRPYAIKARCNRNYRW